MQGASLCCFRQGVAGISWGLGRDIPGLKNFMQENFGLIFCSLVIKVGRSKGSCATAAVRQRLPIV